MMFEKAWNHAAMMYRKLIIYFSSEGKCNTSPHSIVMQYITVIWTQINTSFDPWCDKTLQCVLSLNKDLDTWGKFSKIQFTVYSLMLTQHTILNVPGHILKARKIDK